ncbi:MAG: exodeoxyribonuclease VII small subunit [Acidobacteriota bacterium]|nr:exodeoxyribonuclease VII small subunit [Blastocatellia bacterium]MDW8240284.1 exodeoxyribonuclease VII small subunit [Acidobacteriota bacterium]
MMTKATREPTFESALKELENIVEQLERGDLPLEKSLELFERGIGLTRICQQRLDEAERKIEMLVQTQNGQTTTVPFDADLKDG